MRPADASLYRRALWPVWLGVGFLWLLRWLPFPLQAALGNGVGWLMALRPSRRRRLADTHLALGFPAEAPATRHRCSRNT